MASHLLFSLLSDTHMHTLRQAAIQFITEYVILNMHISHDTQQILWHSLWSNTGLVDGVHDWEIYKTAILFNTDTCQNLLSTKYRFSLYFYGNMAGLNVDLLRKDFALCFCLLQNCVIGGLQQTAMSWA
jgi:hypothetical protein